MRSPKLSAARASGFRSSITELGVTPPRLAAHYQRDLALFAVAFAAICGLGLCAMFAPELVTFASENWLVLAAMGLALVVAPTRLWRPAYHALANAAALEAPKRLEKVWVVDGDTIDDLATGVRYRVANIDAPETGDNARCATERVRGEAARWVTVQLVRGASVVSVRRTFRTDRFGRRVAYVLIDGADLGDALVSRGLARPWRGHRVKWCGPRGGLAKASKTAGGKFLCQSCQRWR
jgi:micrococcal nuclease